jgi:serine/threonine protein kinase
MPLEPIKEEIEKPIIEKFIPRLTILKEIGRGGFGTVNLCEINGEKFALKKIDKLELTQEDEYLIKREIKMLEFLKDGSFCSENMLCFRGYDEDENFYYILTDYVDRNEYRELSFIFDQELIKNIYKAITNLHKLGVAHLDIKPNNILVNPKTKHVILIDFGGSCNSINDIDYDEIYSFLMDESNAIDGFNHNDVLIFLDEIGCNSADDLEFLDKTDFDKLIGHMHDKVARKKLIKLLNNDEPQMSCPNLNKNIKLVRTNNYVDLRLLKKFEERKKITMTDFMNADLWAFGIIVCAMILKGFIFEYADEEGTKFKNKEIYEEIYCVEMSILMVGAVENQLDVNIKKSINNDIIEVNKSLKSIGFDKKIEDFFECKKIKGGKKKRFTISKKRQKQKHFSQTPKRQTQKRKSKKAIKNM